MILKPLSSFEQGDRVQIILSELNLGCGAGKEYPNMGTGTVVFPYYTDSDGVDIDTHKQLSLEDERLVFVLLDEPFSWFNSELWNPKKQKKGKDELLGAIAVPEWLLKEI